VLGYRVHRNGKIATGDRWYEIFDEDGLAFQISMPPPSVEELIVDLPYFIDGKAGIGSTDYWCACEDTGKLHDLLSRARFVEVSDLR
jgi:hypothetical protein